MQSSGLIQSAVSELHQSQQIVKDKLFFHKLHKEFKFCSFPSNDHEARGEAAFNGHMTKIPGNIVDEEEKNPKELSKHPQKSVWIIVSLTDFSHCNECEISGGLCGASTP